jgi:hypothetical protein
MPDKSTIFGILLLEKPGKTRPMNLAQDFARVVGLSRIDVLSQLRSPHNFILPCLTEEKAVEGARYLVSQGIAAVPQLLDALDIPHGSGFIRNADPKPEGFLVQNANGADEALIPWNQVRGALAFHRLGAPEKTRPISIPTENALLGQTDRFGSSSGSPSLFNTAYHEGIWSMLNRALSEPSFVESLLRNKPENQDVVEISVERSAKSVSQLGGGSEDDVLVLIMGTAPVVITLIERGGFKYDYLGERLSLSARLNFPTLVKDVCRFGHPLYVNDGVLSIIRDDKPPREKVDGAHVPRWALEHVLALNLFEKCLVPPEVTAAIGDDECILTYLD